MNKPSAQDALRKSSPLFGELTTFQKAYPQVKDFSVQVQAMPMGFGRGETYSYTLQYPPGQYTPCPNPSCSHGGFDIGGLLYELISQKRDAGDTKGRCRGEELIGRSGGRMCCFSFSAKASLTYHDAPCSPDQA